MQFGTDGHTGYTTTTCAKVRARLFFLTSLLWTAIFCMESMGRSITIVIRYDDFCDRSPSTVEKQLFELFARRHVPLVVSVIPYCQYGEETRLLSREKRTLLKLARLQSEIEIALHGYTHAALTTVAGKKSEFAGLPKYRQMAMLERGRIALEKSFHCKVTTFVPPWSTYDEVTVKCLEELGFDCLSSDLRGPFPATEELKFAPATCGLGELSRALISARAMPVTNVVIVALFHSYDLAGGTTSCGKISITWLDYILARANAASDIQFSTMKRLCSYTADLGWRRAAWNRALYLCFLPCLPPARCSPKLLPCGIFLDEAAAKQLSMAVAVAVLGIYTALMLAVSAVSCVVIRRLAAGRRWAVVLIEYVSLAAIPILVWIAVRDGEVGFRAMTCIAVILGAFLGSRTVLRKWRPR